MTERIQIFYKSRQGKILGGGGGRGDPVDPGEPAPSVYKHCTWDIVAGTL